MKTKLAPPLIGTRKYFKGEKNNEEHWRRFLLNQNARDLYWRMEQNCLIECIRMQNFLPNPRGQHPIFEVFFPEFPVAFFFPGSFAFLTFLQISWVTKTTSVEFGGFYCPSKPWIVQQISVSMAPMQVRNNLIILFLQCCRGHQGSMP